MADRSYTTENDRERRRLEALVGKLDDATLGRPMPAGWTVAAVLAHLAFWDQRIVLFCERLRRGASVPAIDSPHVDWINDAAKPMQLALPPRRAAVVPAEGAGAAARAGGALWDELLGRNAAAGSPLNALREEHRRGHLNEIEQARAKG